jgi:succinate dehydrogenase/fumarate reductase flavoprotein subunit
VDVVVVGAGDAAFCAGLAATEQGFSVLTLERAPAVGGLSYFNYPGGTGLMNGSVFGRIAGTTAGQRAAQSP